MDRNKDNPMVAYVRQLTEPQDVLIAGYRITGGRGDLLCEANGCLWIESMTSLKKHYKKLWQMADNKTVGFVITTCTHIQMRNAFRLFRQMGLDEGPLLGHPYDRVVILKSGVTFILREMYETPGVYEYIPIYIDTRCENKVVFM